MKNRTKIVIFSQSEFCFTFPLIFSLMRNKNFEIERIIIVKDKFGIKRLLINLFFFGFKDFSKICWKNLFPPLNKKTSTLLLNLNKGEFLDGTWYQLYKMKSSIGLSINFPLKIPCNVINFFEYGIYNIHNSDLPLYGGLMPIYRKIINQDTNFVVTVQKINEKLDQGLNVFQGSIKKSFCDNKRPYTIWLKLNNISTKYLKKIELRDLALVNKKEINQYKEKSYYGLPLVSDMALFYFHYHLLRRLKKSIKTSI